MPNDRGGGDVWVGVTVTEFQVSHFQKGNVLLTQRGVGLQEYSPFRNTPENRKSIQCLINLLQIDFT